VEEAVSEGARCLRVAKMFGEFGVSKIFKSEVFELLRVELQTINQMNLRSMTWVWYCLSKGIKENGLVCFVTGRYIFGRSRESICGKIGLA
jgi:hypothetical protein